MTDESRRIWERALFGRVSAGDVGCLGQALASTDWPVNISALEDEITLLEREINAHRSVREAAKQWSSCMAEAGYSYATPNDIVRELEQVAAPLIGRVEAIKPRPTSVEQLPEEIYSAVDKTTAFELAVADADLTCRERHLNAVTLAVQTEIHERFLSENPTIALSVKELT